MPLQESVCSDGDWPSAAVVRKAWQTPDDSDAADASSPKLKVESIPVADKAEVISMCRKITFSAPTAATLPFVAMWGMHGNKNYQAFGASLAIIALSTALARSLDVVSDPLVSYWTDSSSCRRLPHWLRGRRKPFMFVGCFFYSGFLWLLLNPPYVDETSLSAWFGFFYTLYFLANTCTCIPYDALAPELSTDSDQRTGLFFVSNIFDGVGTLIALGLPIMMTSLAGKTSRNEAICKDDMERARLCLSFRTCGNFLEMGKPGAYEENLTLKTLMANFEGDSTSDPARDCVTWLTTRAMNDSALVPHPTAMQSEGFCHCMVTCADSCNVANQRTGFMLVGYIFAIWFVVTMVLVVYLIPERPLAKEAPKAAPILPSMRRTLSNKPFRILLPAWLCDAFVNALVMSLTPFFVEGVVAPAYQTMEHNGRDCYKSTAGYIKDGREWFGEAGRRDSDKWDMWCSTDNVIGICGLLALTSAIVVLPVWNLLVRMLGKVRTWLLWTMTMAATNLLFLFVPKGHIYFLWLVSAVNGAPLGAKFLADSILADIIDYDEFLTGARSEATYFMFKSFLPKIVQIPAAAIPIALLTSFGYLAPVGGNVQEQPSSVSLYIRCVVFLGFIVSVAAFCVKRRYPLNDRRMLTLTSGLLAHKAGDTAIDPMSGKIWKPYVVQSEEEHEIFSLLGHFAIDHLRHVFVGLEPSHSTSDDAFQEHLQAGCKSICKLTQKQLIGAVLFLVVALSCTGISLPLLWSEKLQFVPTLFVVCVGISITVTALAVVRRQAASKLLVIARDHEGEGFGMSVQCFLQFQAELNELGVAVEATTAVATHEEPVELVEDDMPAEPVVQSHEKETAPSPEPQREVNCSAATLGQPEPSTEHFEVNPSSIQVCPQSEPAESAQTDDS